jgi:hypothetical protein
MATTTPNFGWPVPTSTDLVKDGATAIESLGDSIDASLLDLKGGTTGQVLSKNSNTDMDFTWVAQDDSNAIQNAIVDAKGDLIAATAADTPARLAVGTNGQVLTADSTAATGLKWASASTAFSGALVTKTSAQAITGSTNTLVTWDTEANGFDTNSYHDNTTNNQRLTVPTAGYYRITGQITLDASANGYRNLSIIKNGSTGILGISTGPNSVDWTYIPFTFTALLAANDYLTLSVFFSGANPNIQGNNTYGAVSNFSAIYLGA